MDPLAALREKAFGTTSDGVVSSGSDPLEELKKKAGLSYQQATTTTPEPIKKKTAVGQFLSGVKTALTRDVAANFKTVLPTLDRTLYNSIVNMRGEGYIPREQALTYYQDKQKKVDEYKQKTEDKLKAKLGEDYNSLSMQMGRGLGQGITQIATGFIPVVGPGLSVALNSAQIGASAQNDYRDAYEGTIAKGGSKQEATKNARIVGTVSGVVNSAEMLVPGKILFAEKLMGKGFYNGLKQFAKTAATETLTEGLQDTAVSFAEQQTYDETANPIKDGLTSMLVSLPSSLLFGGVDVVSNKVSQAKLQETAKAMVVDQIKKGVAPDIAVDNAVNIISTMSDFSENDIFQNVGRDILEQSKDASELFQMEMDRQIADPSYVPDKSKMEFAKEIIRAKNIYEMNNAKEIGNIQREDGSTIRIDVVPFSDDQYVAKITTISPDGIETVNEIDEIFKNEEDAMAIAREQLTPQDIEVGTGPLFRMREPVDNSVEMVDTTISDTGTLKPEQVDKTINKQYDTTRISKRTKDTVGGIQNASDRATQYMGRLLRMEQVQDSTRTDTGGGDTDYQNGVRIKKKEFSDGKLVPISNMSIVALVDMGMREDTADVIVNFSKQKNNPVQAIYALEFDEDFAASFDTNQITINTRYISSITPNEMKHEYSHAWFKSQTREFKQDFINNLKQDKELIYEAWSNTTSPYNDYAKQQFELFKKLFISLGYTEDLAKKIVTDSGLKSSYETVNEFIDDSFNIMSYTESMNSVLLKDGKGKFFFREYNSIAINEHIAVIAEFSEELESDNEIINNFIEMSDNGTYDFGTALQDKGPVYLRKSDIPTVEMQMEYNKTFAIDEDALTNRINEGKKYISILNEQIREHPGKQIAKFVSRKEGEFIDKQFQVIPSPKNKTEELRNERARKLTRKVESLINNYGIDGEYKGSYVVQDVAQMMYDDYIALVKKKQTFLEDLRDDKKKFKEQTAAEKGLIKTLAESAVTALKRSLIPPSERKVWMEKASEIGTDQKKFDAYVKDITERTAEIEMEQNVRLDAIYKRQEISKLRAYNNISPKMISDIKKTLGLTETVNKLSLPQLRAMTDEINKRIDFIERNGYNVNMSAQRKPTKDELTQIGKDSYKLQKQIKPKIVSFFDSIGGYIKKKLTPVSERIKKIAPDIAAKYSKMQRDIQIDINKYGATVDKYFKEYEKLTGEDQEILKSYLLNKDYKSATELFQEKGLDVTALDDIRTMLKEIYEMLRAAGVDINELNGHFPRFLTRKGMGTMKEMQSAVDNAIKAMESSLGRDLSINEKSDLRASLLVKSSYGMQGLITLSDGRYGQSRNMEYINHPEILKLYENTVTSLNSYLAGAINLYHQRAFLGKIDPEFLSEDNKGKTLDEQFAKLKLDISKYPDITTADLEELNSLLYELLKPVEYSAVRDTLTNLAYNVGLGQLTASVTQMSELLPASMMFGLPKNFNISVDQVGISDQYQIDVEKSSKLGRIIMKPMTFGDKNVSAKYLVNAIANHINKIVNGKVSDIDLQNLRKNIEYIYGAENVESVIDTIKGYDFEKATSLPPELGMMIYLYSSVLRVVNRGDKIEWFLKYPIMGVFKNFGMKTLHAIFTSGNNLMKEGLKRGDYSLVARGAARKSGLLGGLIAAQVGAAMLKDLIKGNTDNLEDDEWILNYILDAFAKILFLSMYQIQNVKRIGGPGTILTDIVLPAPASLPAGLIDSLYRDIDDSTLFDLEETKTLKRIPLVGDIIDIAFQRD
jgi:hypothetical protein